MHTPPTSQRVGPPTGPLPTCDEIFQASVDCLKVIDATGILVQVCEYGQVALEYEGDCPALGSCWFDFWDDAYRLLAERAVASALEQGSGRFVGFCATFKKTPKWWDVLVSPLQTHAGALYFLVSSRDISSMKRQERDNLQAIHELERERQNREQFVATLSHDLRNPLSAARTSAQLIIRKTQDQARLQSLAARIDRCLERADSMITDLLDVAQIRAGKTIQIGVEAIDLKKLAQETLQDLSLTAGPRFKLVCNVPFVDALSNHHAFRRILENLASNALKYGDPTTDVTVTLERRPQEVLLGVHNKGPHIAAQDCTTLFEIYRRTASAQSGKQAGWGLGLTVVKGLSQALGGTAWVESSAEAGTTFWVRLKQPPEDEVNVERVPQGETQSEIGDVARPDTHDTGEAPRSPPEHSPRWLESVLWGVSDAVVGSTANGRISLLNRAAERACGYLNAEGCGLKTRTVLRRLDGASDHMTDYVHEAGSPGLACEAQLLLVPRIGEAHAVRAQVTPLYDDAGSALGLIYIFATG